MKLIKHSRHCDFINDSANEILKILNIDYNDCAFSFNHDFYLKEYDFEKYNNKLKEELSKYNIKDMIVCDRVLFEDIKKTSFKAMFLGDIVVKDLLKHNLSGFNVAFYNGLNDMSYVKDIFDGAKFVKYENMFDENGYRFINFNEELSYKIASSIVLDAYDSGADFMVVDDCYSFYMFDYLSAKLQSYSNRDFDDFYILSFTELLAICLGLRPNSLNKHKLKVSLLWKFL